MKRILLLSDFSSKYVRSLLRGILRYSQEVGDWSFQRIPLHYYQFYGENIITKLANELKADAIIGQLSNINIDKLKTMDIPIILQNYTNRVEGVSNITGDYFNTGVMAAEFYIKKGYTNFAYYGSRKTVWSREREDGFISRLTKSGYHVNSFNDIDMSEDIQNSDIKASYRWLNSLPKPLALFACDDFRAIQVTEICRLCGLKIPQDVAVLGVDNDELMCNMSYPPLSSIVLDVENGGYQAAEQLDKMMNDRTTESFNIVISPIKIQLRQSTEINIIKDPVVLDIINIIENETEIRKTVSDILKDIPLSRRIIEKRFRAATSTSIYKYVLDHRISQYADSLLTSEKSPIETAESFGFDDYSNLSRLFKRYKGITPIQYWKKYKKNQ